MSEVVLHILLIEENPGNIRLIERLFTKVPGCSFHLECVNSFAAGLARLAQGDIDLVLLDIHLSDSQGLEGIVKVREQAPGVPVVVLIGRHDQELALKTIQLGAQDYLMLEKAGPNTVVRIVLNAYERHRIRKLLAKSEDGFRKIIEKNRDAILIIDQKGTVIFANPEATRLFHRPDEEILGQPFGAPVVGEDAKIQIIRPGASPAIAEMLTVEIEWEGESVTLASLRDVTEREATDAALRKATQELQQTLSKLEEAREVIEEKNRSLAQLAIRDDLTGLYNRRYLLEVLEKEFSLPLRYHTDLSCLLIDLDYFKYINDNFGHAFGDLVLKEFGHHLAGYTRISDLCFRCGGEEFLVLLPQTDIIGAQQAAEKIRQHCESHAYTDGINQATVTVSLGVASVRYHQVSRSADLLACADKALYLAKAEGRNRIKVYQQVFEDIRPSETALSENEIRCLKERLSMFLENTKKSSLASLEFLIQGAGGFQFRDHNQRVLHYLELIGNKLRFPPTIVETMKRAAKLHDYFKVLLAEALAEKGSLTEAARSKIRDHPYMLAELTELFDFFSEERAVLLAHHENFDGSGYPEGLQGDQIPVGARILSIADALAAMTSERPYRESLPPPRVIQELVTNAGSQFDPWLVDRFLEIIADEQLLLVSQEELNTAMEQVRQVQKANFSPAGF